MPSPAKAPPLRTVDLGHSFRTSSPQRAMPPPPCVTNGITVLPERSWLARKEATGGAIVLHQLGLPMKITSYLPMSSTLAASSGLTPS